MPEVLFVHNAVLTDDERLYTSYPVLGRGGDQGETSDHHTFHNEIHFAERNSGSLSIQNLKK